MKQGFSGSTVTRKGDVVVKRTSDVGFLNDTARHSALQALSRRLHILPTIAGISGADISMEYTYGVEGLSLDCACEAGVSLRILHNQTKYSFPVFTGAGWLLELAGQALSKRQISRDILPSLEIRPGDLKLIHTEPVQLIAKAGGGVVFIDFEGIGMGSMYQDLGYIYCAAAGRGTPKLFDKVIAGYNQSGVRMAEIKRFAGVISIAYSKFADSERRIDLGMELLQDA